MSTLYDQAVVIRDESSEKQNTAYRVGTLFIGIIEALSQTLNSGNITIVSDATGTNMVFSVPGSDGNTTITKIPIPTLTTSVAGVLTPAQVSAIKQEASNLVTAEKDKRVEAIEALTNTLGSISDSANTAKTEADSALSKANTNEQAIETLTNSFSNLSIDFNTASGKLNRLFSEGSKLIGLWNSPVATYDQNQPNAGLPSDSYTTKVFWICKNVGYYGSFQLLEGEIYILEYDPVHSPALWGWYKILDQSKLNDEITRATNAEKELYTSLVNTISKTIYKLTTNYSDFETAIAAVPKDNRESGMILVCMVNSEWKRKQYIASNITDAYFTIEDNWEELGGDSSIGNVYNVTNESPISGFYSLCNTTDTTHSAVHVAWSNKKASLGLIISFAFSSGHWKTYQYTGKTLTQEQWIIPDNWTDFGSLAAGSEAYIIIDNLVGAPKIGYYNLESAVTALLAFQESSGITYAKTGLIIAYKIAENTLETKQFNGAISDIGEVALWKDFGGGGSKVTVFDKPIKGGTDAFSTGGAYNEIPVNLDVNTEETGIVKLAMKNAAGSQVGDEIQFAVGTGTGETSGTIVAIAFQKMPLYGAYGQTISTKVAIRSLTTVGTTETENSIDKLELVDRDSGLTVWKQTKSAASSGSLTDYTFNLDFTSFFSAAGARRFKLVATDDGGHTGSKNINVTAVDVTCTCVQVLGYTADNVISPTASSISIPLYKFANNTSDQGITSRVDIFLKGVWTNVASTVITDTFTHSLTLHPSDLGLTHGAYQLRIQGEDVASGTKGNIIYTSIMVVDTTSAVPIVSLRYNDKESGKIKLYETVQLDIAAYDPNNVNPHVALTINGTQFTQILATRGSTFSIKKQINGYATDGTATLVFNATSGAATSNNVSLVVYGSAIDAAIKEGAIYDFDFSTRSNNETDHSITSKGYAIELSGANYRTNGFGTFLGENCLRVAENVTAGVSHYPFSQSSVENTGCAIQFSFAAKNIENDDTKLIECYDPDSGVGFYANGKKIGIFCKNGIAQREERSYPEGEKITVAIVIEPTTIYLSRSGVQYSRIVMYLNGEEVANIGYVGGKGNITQNKNITMNGTNGDFYLYYLTAWNDYFGFSQAFKNYLVKLADTEVMVEEYDFENVLVSQTAEGNTMDRPSAALLYARGIPYIVEAPYNGSDIEALDNTTSTSSKIYITLYYYNPLRPWTNFKKLGVQKRNQGTTSAKRPVKNDRFYLAPSKCKDATKIIELLNPDNTTTAGQRAISLAEQSYVQVGENTIPVQLITVKVDYSDSSNANDCGVCETMNATFRALGSNYMTPIQRNFDGTWLNGTISLSGLQLNHSTANHSVAVFRCQDETLQNVYFHAKGNWKEDKSEQVALGFKNTPGYNMGCLNYQDGSFKEYFGLPAESITDIVARFLADTSIDTTKVYLLSMYCGSSYRIYRYVDGVWKNTTGTMKQVDGKWTVTGDVLNPITGFELLNYEGMCWFMGVSSIDDMMAISTNKSAWVQKLVDAGSISATTFPAWTYYFECMVDNDQLAIDFALGKKVPFELYTWLRFCNDCDYSTGTVTEKAAKLLKWKKELYLYANPRSLMSYDIFTDYMAAVDQQAKNMQPMWMLEDGQNVTGGEYSVNSVKMYMNKIYDCDCCNGEDNDGGETVDPETDPNKNSTETFTNPYAGHGSILFKNLYSQPTVNIDSVGTEISMRTVAAAMRSVQTTIDGKTIAPFSPEGAQYIYVDKRLKIWPKSVSSYDGERKYNKYTATSDTIYFYAMHGLRLTALPDFLSRRWRYRDGFYQTGKFFSSDGIVSGRVGSASTATIKITAAKSGYFGIGNDSSGNLSESVYLEAGQEYTFTKFSHEEGALLYIYQADRMKKLDVSEISLSSTANFGVMKLCQELIIGSPTHTESSIGAYDKLTSLPLGDMPFLTTLDIRNTIITNVNAEQCPRLRHIYAVGSSLQSLSIAQTSPINDITLPNTMTDLIFLGLPLLTYAGLSSTTGMQIKTFPNVIRMRVESSPNLNVIQMIKDVVSSQASGTKKFSLIRINDMSLQGDGSELLYMISLGIKGLDGSGSQQDKPVINGTYGLTVIRDVEQVQTMQNAFDGLTITTIITAFINLIDEINAEYYNGTADSTLPVITLSNIDELAISYYNGEQADASLIYNG